MRGEGEVDSEGMQKCELGLARTTRKSGQLTKVFGSRPNKAHLLETLRDLDVVLNPLTQSVKGLSPWHVGVGGGVRRKPLGDTDHV